MHSISSLFFLFYLFLFQPLIISQWSSPIVISQHPVSDIKFADNSLGWACIQGGYTFSSYGEFLRSTNGGSNWIVIASGMIAYAEMSFINSNTGWIVGGSGTDIPGSSRYYIFRTTNGGQNLVELKRDSVNFKYYTSVFFLNQNTGWISGNKLIYKTSNGGINFFNLNVDTNFIYNEVRFADMNTGYVIQGFGNSLLKTINGGANWLIVQIETPIVINTLQVLNSENIILGGNNGKIKISSNGGNSWDTMTINNSGPVNSVFFINSNSGWANVNSSVYRTTNRGINWILQNSANTLPIRSIFFLDSNTGWAAGGYGDPLRIGMIMKTTNGGLLGIENNGSNLPNEYVLFQNYPNPFNPTTNIKYEVPRDVNVSIKIYDLLGKEVFSINEYKKAGSYEVKFDGVNFASGMYFYQITAGGFTDTKKMVLLK